MIGATLSRYEAWPVAAVVAAFIGLRRDEPVFYRRALLAALPLVGPVFWILHNRIAHGDALSFLHRVSSYKAALGAGGANAIGAYLWGVLAGCPAVLALFVGLVVLATRGNDRDELRRRLARYVPFGIAALALAAFLSIGDLVGGAPTHHPERVLLVVWLACALAAADLATVVRPPPALVAVVVLLLALDYRATLADRGVDRRSEETSGAQLRSLVPRGEHVVVATTDYGYFAVIAAFGRPSDAIVDLSHDPRVKSEKSIVADHWHAPDHLRQEGARWLVAPSTAVFPMALRERTRDATLAIYELER
jgi:hypothetical protein